MFAISNFISPRRKGRKGYFVMALLCVLRARRSLSEKLEGNPRLGSHA